MDYLTTLCLLLAAALLLVLAYHEFTSTRFPDLPGPSLRDYLPGGLANKLFTDLPTLQQTLLKLDSLYGPVYEVRMGHRRTISVSSPADISHITSDSKVFVRAREISNAFDSFVPRSLFSMGYAEHLTARRALRAKFNHSLLPDFHVLMSKVVQEMVDKLYAVAMSPTAQFVDINNILATVTTGAMLTVALGFDLNASERSACARNIDIIAEEALQEFIYQPVRQIFSLFGLRARMNFSREKLEALSRRFIAARVAETAAERAARSPDLLDAILSLDNHDNARTVSEVTIFIMTGSHTVSVSTAWALYHLSQNEHVLTKVRAEMDDVLGSQSSLKPLTREEVLKLSYLNCVWKETLRINPVAAGILRETTKDVTLRGTGVMIPRGTQVHANITAVHRNTEFFEDPECFIPERWNTDDRTAETHRLPPGAFIPFGLGQRSCAGQFFAEYEGPLVLAELLRRFRFELACPVGEVRWTSAFVEMPKWSSKGDGKLNMGVPMFVHLATR